MRYGHWEAVGVHMQWERAEMLVKQQYHCEMQAMGVV